MVILAGGTVTIKLMLHQNRRWNVSLGDNDVGKMSDKNNVMKKISEVRIEHIQSRYFIRGGNRASVSYTHLDVYKRQSVTTTLDTSASTVRLFN